MVKNRFIFPPKISVDGYEFAGCSSYSEYNYLRKGLASKIKRRHFEIALDLVSEHFHKENVIDFGSGDGVFIPSLSHYFNHVAAVDLDPIFFDMSKKIVEKMGLENVDVINNRELSIEEVKKKFSGRKYHILFLLEVLEHVCSDPDSMYETRMNFLGDMFKMLDESGKIIISVPKMVGISFLIQYAGLSFLGINRYEISLRNVLKAGILKDTSDVENGCVPSEKYGLYFSQQHIGFNHLKLEKYMQKEFRIRRKVDDLFQVLYVLERP
jgi:2-polyprenyl-3-methyl-5-hydroxy-6-metoxy-1,4-benzoquinol methylase